jgi:hypothetical protein
MTQPRSQPTLEQDVIHFHTWHQRLAHCSESKLRATQKHVDGIPPFKHGAIPPVVTCRACDIAKLRKAPRGPTELEAPPNLQPGQIFQMDIGLHQGPDQLRGSS